MDHLLFCLGFSMYLDKWWRISSEKWSWRMATLLTAGAAGVAHPPCRSQPGVPHAPRVWCWPPLHWEDWSGVDGAAWREGDVGKGEGTFEREAFDEGPSSSPECLAEAALCAKASSARGGKRGVKPLAVTTLALSFVACLLCWESVLPPRSHGPRAFAIAMQRPGRGRRQAPLQAAWPFHVTLALPCPEPVLGVQLGEGGFRVDYLGSFCSFDVAVKTLKQSQADSSKDILHEHNVWTFSGGPGVLMELVAASLVQWAHALPRLCMEILGALAYMHSRHIIRKGLKLDNILVSDLLP